jgi:LEA14-like dessication related protein
VNRTLLFLLPLSIACDELDAFTPDVAFERMEVRSIDFEQISADFVFAVDNPNPIGIGLARFDYDLALEGHSLVSGTDPDGLRLEPSASSELSLPVTLVYTDIYDTVQATRGEDDVDFALTGAMGFNTPFGPFELPYDARGSFPAVRAPGIELGGLRLNRLDLARLSATAELDLVVDNDHGSAIELVALDYAVDFTGTEVVAGAMELGATVPGADKRTVTLPLTLDLLNVGVSVITALSTGGRVEVGFTASASIDTPFGILPLTIDELGDLQVR